MLPRYPAAHWDCGGLTPDSQLPKEMWRSDRRRLSPTDLHIKAHQPVTTALRFGPEAGEPGSYNTGTVAASVTVGAAAALNTLSLIHISRHSAMPISMRQMLACAAIATR